MSLLAVLLIFQTVLTKISIALGITVLLLLTRGLIWLFNLLVVAPRLDPLRNAPGPDKSPLDTHLPEVSNPERSAEFHSQWSKTFGKTFRFQGFGKHDYRLMSLDFKTVSYFLNSLVYEKPWQTRSILTKFFGRGVFVMEGAEHKFQRKVLGPAFTTRAVKAMSPVFFQKAEELRNRWETFVSQAPLQDSRPTSDEPFSNPTSPAYPHGIPSAIIDVAHWTTRAAFDVIGLAGFNYNFGSLQEERDEVYLAYRRMFDVVNKNPGFKALAMLYFPILQKICPDEASKVAQECSTIIRREGKKMVDAKKAEILAEKFNLQHSEDKDILSLIIKSNLSSDPTKAMSDIDLLDQVSTFLFAGSDSTSLTMAWCLHFISLHPEIQTRLREEVLSLQSTPDLESQVPIEARTDAIDALPLLDAVIRETLRVVPPVHSTIRVATADDRIPVSHPITMRDGSVLQPGDFLPIKKGSFLHIPIEGLNLSEDIWGADALVFNPDRWSSLPPTARAPTHPGLANLMTFSFGPHACPGYKFTILQTKIFLATLLQSFVFENTEVIRKHSAILTRPYVENQWEKGHRLPVRVRKYVA